MIQLTKSIISKICDDISRDDILKIELKTYKGDRGIVLSKSNLQYVIDEFGYKNQKILCDDLNKLKKFIKKIIKLEFPRSNKVQYHITHKI